MKIAVMSDIHGFAPAFEAVLADVERHDVDQIIVAGDLFEGGPQPSRVLELLQEHDVRCIYGNTDRDLLANEVGASDLITWTRNELASEGLTYIRDLPFSIRVPHSSGSSPQDDLLVVHANPTDVERHLSPNASDREIREILGEETSRTIVFGHLHIAYTRTIDDHALVDISAVGNPRDGDLRPRYAVFSDASNGRWEHVYHYVDYPLDRTHQLMEASGMPNWKKAYARLESATYNRPV